MYNQRIKMRGEHDHWSTNRSVYNILLYFAYVCFNSEFLLHCELGAAVPNRCESHNVMSLLNDLIINSRRSARERFYRHRSRGISPTASVPICIYIYNTTYTLLIMVIP